MTTHKTTMAHRFTWAEKSDGGKTRARKMTPERRREIAQIAARARWEKRRRNLAAEGAANAGEALDRLGYRKGAAA